MAAYLTLLLDLEKEGGDRIVEGTLRFTPDHDRIPANAFQWKVTCDARGLVVVRGSVGANRFSVIATARWDGTLHDKRQRDTTPNKHQWKLVEEAIVAASAVRKADPTPYDDTLVEEVSRKDAAALGVPPEALPSMLGDPKPARREGRRVETPPRFWLTVLGFVGLVAASVIVLVMMCGGPPKDSGKRWTTNNPPPPPKPRPAPAPPPADTFARRLATHRLQWADVGVPAETTIEQAEKEPAEEKGKRLCVEGTIGSITRADRGGVRLYRGDIESAAGDRVAFVVGGTTGALVKRAKATVCGVVTGYHDGAVTMEGLFDLPENRNPIVEKDH